MPIRVLDKHVAELIAAGEVVERPSSVIKELVENSIDAGAKTITVEIQNGGVTYMRITDDGCGIAFDEVPVAFLRHATSKVRTQTDLACIGTLGFRGEALASIAAVAKVDMLTSTGSGNGCAYSIHGGEEVAYSETGCPRGTTIVVRDLFYNTPARMKFLKKDVSEANAVAAVLDRMALSHPEIAFRLIRDGKPTLSTSGKGGLEAAVYSVYGREFSNGLIPLQYRAGSLTLGGLICRPDQARKSRSMQHFFINGRYIKSNTMAAALEQAYKGSIMVGRFPSCVLELRMPGSEVDINVHPAKLECRFTNEKAVFDIVYYGVRTALQSGDVRREITLTDKPFRVADADKTPARQLHYRQTADWTAAVSAAERTPRETETPAPEKTAPPPVRSTPPAFRPIFRPDCFVDDDEPSVTPRVSSPTAPYRAEREKAAAEPKAETIPVPAAEPSPASLSAADTVSDEPEIGLRLIGETFGTYALVEHGDEILVIDKHAAHERILYEKLKAHRHNEAQMLLEPQAVTLSKEELSALTEHAQEIADAGFELEEFGTGCMLVRAVPTLLSDCDVAPLIEEIAAGFLNEKNAVEIDRLDWLYHNMACRAAVKGGDRSGQDLMALAERIADSDDIRYCPHGRPVAFRLTRKELEKQFGRQG